MINLKINGKKNPLGVDFGEIRLSLETDLSYTVKEYTFNLYKDLLKIRKQNKAFAGGKMSIVGNDDNSNVMSYFIESKGQKLLIAHCVKNQSGVLDLNGLKLGKEVYSTYSLNQYKNDLEKDDSGNYTFSKANTYKIENGQLKLNPYATVIFEVNK